MELNSFQTVNPTEICYLEVDRLTSVDIRVYITFRNRDVMWTRISEEKAVELLKIFNGI